MSRWWRYAVVVCALFILGAISPVLSTAQNSKGSPIAGTLTVFAASSLTESFIAIGQRLESRHPGLQILFNFAGSQALRTQLEQGAPADVFASANAVQMDLAKKSGVVHDDTPVFIKNRLVIVVPSKNPGQVRALRDLATPGLKLVLAGRHVPAGRYSHQVLSRAAKDNEGDFGAQVLQNLVSEEHNVKQVVTKIQLGEGDAGIAYISDITPHIENSVRIIAIPDAYNQLASYPIAIVKDTRQPEAAKVFIDFVRSDQGQLMMKAYNFVPVVE